jgi:hypothetical protein
VERFHEIALTLGVVMILTAAMTSRVVIRHHADMEIQVVITHVGIVAHTCIGIHTQTIIKTIVKGRCQCQ